MGKVGAKILRIIEYLVKQLNKKYKIYYHGDFIYSSNQPYKFIRKRDDSESVTNVDFISKDEIQNVIMLVLSKEISTPREELISKVARVFGFQHTGKKIQDRIKKQITSLLKNKKISDSTFRLEISNQFPQP